MKEFWLYVDKIVNKELFERMESGLKNLRYIKNEHMWIDNQLGNIFSVCNPKIEINFIISRNKEIINKSDAIVFQVLDVSHYK